VVNKFCHHFDSLPVEKHGKAEAKCNVTYAYAHSFGERGYRERVGEGNDLAGMICKIEAYVLFIYYYCIPVVLVLLFTFSLAFLTSSWLYWNSSIHFKVSPCKRLCQDAASAVATFYKASITPTLLQLAPRRTAWQTIRGRSCSLDARHAA